MATLTTVLSYFVCLELFLFTIAEARTTISFQFHLQLYSDISNVNLFQTTLETDILHQFKLPQGSIQNMKVTESTQGTVQTNMVLDIDTDNATLVTYRQNFENSLRNGIYYMRYNETIYAVQSSSLVFEEEKDSFFGSWNAMVLEVFIAAMVAIMCLAIFIFAIFCYTRPKFKKRRQTAESRTYENRGYNSHEMRYTNRRNTNDRLETQSIGSMSTLRSHRIQPDTFFDKLTYANYSVPPQHMHSYL